MLVGLGAPEPNLVAWTTNPTVDGLRACVRNVHGVSLLTGFPDLMSLMNYSSDTLRAAARTLGNLLFPPALEQPVGAAQPARVVKLGPVRVRL